MPLEIALSRQVMRIVGSQPDPRDPQAVVVELRAFMDWYIRTGWAVYRIALNKVKEEVDLVVDGMLPPDQIAEEIFKAVMKEVKEIE